MYRRAWNGRMRRTMSRLSFSASTPAPAAAASTKSAGDGRPLPTTMHAVTRSAQVASTLSSIAFVSHRSEFSDLIQSSFRPRDTYAPGRTSWNRSPVW